MPSCILLISSDVNTSKPYEEDKGKTDQQDTFNTHSFYFYTTFTNFTMKYLVMSKVYTDVGGIKYLNHVCPPVRKIIHSLKLVDYLHVQADNPWYNYYLTSKSISYEFQQCGNLTSVDSDEPVQPPFKLRNSKSCSVSSLTLIEYSSDKQRLWSECSYAQADLRLWWSHIPHCWKSHATAHYYFDF